MYVYGYVCVGAPLFGVVGTVVAVIVIVGYSTARAWWYASFRLSFAFLKETYHILKMLLKPW